MRKVSAVMCTVVLALLGATGPGMAEVPNNVREGDSGRLDAGWVRAACATSQDGAKCAIRFPREVHRLDLTYLRGGEVVATEDTVTYAKPARGPLRTFNRRVAPGVRLKCGIRGNRATCTMAFDWRLSEFNVNLYNAGRWFGGVRANDGVMRF